jgi:hypothetical protein
MNKMLSDKVKNAILESLDLEENEEFEIKEFHGFFRINTKGLEMKHYHGWDKSPLLNKLLLGEVKIIKSPFVPELTETYYVPDISIACLYLKTGNYDSKYDKHRIKHEICFRTKQEAINKAKEALGLLRGGTDE